MTFMQDSAHVVELYAQLLLFINASLALGALANDTIMQVIIRGRFGIHFAIIVVLLQLQCCIQSLLI